MSPASDTFNRILLKDLPKNRIERLLVMSYEMDIYLANVVIGGQTHLVYESEGQPLKARSQLALKKHFKDLGIRQTHLIHTSSYDEMIGNDIKQSSPLEVRIANPDDDYS